MAFEVEGSFRNTQANSNDSYWYGGGNEAYPSLAVAYATIPAAKRRGLTVGVYIGEDIKEYWWPNAAIDDLDLVLKVADVDLSPLENKVDKVQGKGLSTLDFTQADKDKIDAVPTEINLANKVDKTTTVAGKPLSANITLVKADVGLANVDNTLDSAKPVSTAQATALGLKVDKTITVAGKPLSANVALVKGDVGLGSVDNTADAAKPISTAQAAALENKVDKVQGKGLSTLDYTQADKDKIDAVPTDVNLANKVDKTTTVAGKPLSENITLVKGDVGLGSVDNTADASKPVSTAQATALGLKVDKTITVAGKPLSANVALVKGDVGLTLVDNTADASKPVSTAQAAAIALKVDKVAGKELSSNDFTTAEKAKLASAITQVGASPTTAVNIFKLDASYFADTVYAFRWGTKTATLTTKELPDNSGNQFFIGPYTPNPATHLLPQFQANTLLNSDFVITASATNELTFTARATGPDYNFIEGNTGVNTVKGTLGGLAGMVSENEKDFLRKAIAPVYKKPYATITSTLTDEFIESGQTIEAPLQLMFHKEDGGDFTRAIVFQDGFEVAEVLPDTSGSETIIGFGAGTTGGAGGATVVVTTYAELGAACDSNSPLIIHVSGTITGAGLLYVKSNKSIIGLPGSKIIGIGFSVYGVNNVIFRYLTIEKVVTYSNIIIKELAHHVWVDHCELSSDQDHGWEYYDGLLDVTKQATNVTISNCILRDNNHALLIGGGYESTADAGYLKVTIYNCLFNNITERSPSVRFGEVHVFNCYTMNSNNYCIGSVSTAKVKMNNNYFYNCNNPVTTTLNGFTGYVTGVDTNIYDSCGPNVITTADTPLTLPYTFEAIPVAGVPEMVLLKAGPNGRNVQYGESFSLEVMPNNSTLVWSVSFVYGDGPVKNDVFGKPYQPGQILANTVASNKLVYTPNFTVNYGPVAEDPIQSSHILALPNKRLDNAPDVFSFATGTTHKKQCFVVPPSKQLVSVFEGGKDITAEYILVNASIPVKNAAGWNIEGYQLYIRTMGVPYYSSRTHTITFKPKA